MNTRFALQDARSPASALCLFCLLVIFLPSLSLAAQVPVEPVPDWVRSAAIPPNEADHNEASGSMDFLLLDQQVDLRHDEPVQFVHLAKSIRNAQGLQDNSSLSVSYDPDYESIVIHQIRIHRDGKIIDRLPGADFQIYQRESGLERQLYNGELTIHAVLEDLRVGDTIEFSYSRRGNNPVFGGRFSHFFSMQWEVPLYRHDLRVLTAADKPVSLNSHPRTTELAKSRHDDVVEYLYQADNLPAQTFDSESPGWYTPFNTLTLTEFKGWPDIHAWASGLFETPDEPAPALKALADDIRSSHSTPEERLAAALTFIQREIRYVGIELGTGSYQATAPEVTLQRRFGDCKDKTVLLNTLLDLLDIKNNAVLVNTALRHTLINEPASPLLFDHVITRAQINGETYWVDATNTHQRGKLAYRTPALPGAGLILNSPQHKPVLIQPAIPESAMPRQHVTQRLRLPKEPGQAAELSITTVLGGSEASYMRGRVARSGKEFQEDYLNYYETIYPGIESVTPANLRDDPAQNRIVIEEHYRIPEIWEPSESGDNRTAWLDGDLVSDFLFAPKQRRRKAPYAMYHPVSTQQELNVELDNNWYLPNEHKQVKTPWFDYQRDVHFDGKHLRVSHQFRSLSESVPAGKISTLMDGIDQVNELRYYGLEESTSGVAGDAPISPFAWWIVAISVTLFLIVAGIVDYVMDRTREKTLESGPYYAVDTRKFILLNILSFGLYSVFWGYRNWSYIAKRDDRRLWAWARGLFLGFTLYGLYRDARKTPQQNQTLGLGTVTVALIAVAFFALNLLASSDLALLSFAGLIAATLCLLPLQRYFNQLDGHSERFRFHSRWRIRHGILALFFVVLISIDVASDLYLIPPTHVINGQQVPAKVRVFLGREHLLEPDEKILQFYSAGTFDFFEDGNGLTDRGIFSYWHDASSNLKTEKVRFADIANLTVTPGDFSSPTTVEVIRDDGSYFMLLLSTENGGDQRFADALNNRWLALDEQSL